MKQRIYLPTIYEFIYLFTVSLALLTISLLVPIFKRLDTENYSFVGDTTKNFVSNYLAKLDNPHLVKPLTVLFWMIIGAIVYVVFWIIGATFKTYEDDISPLHGLLAPKDYKKGSELPRSITRVLIRTLAVLTTVAWLVIFLGSTLPYSNAKFLEALNNIDLLSILRALYATLQIVVSLFVFIVLLRLILLRKRIFS